ncbi:MAG: RidA family protein [archaeon GB-1845-036]|nr:RidA family protein [Candidatus Culexmicrobium thermophilum]HDO20304.1 RidA family protein [Candidatus Bathyarchaeota archaeon]
MKPPKPGGAYNQAVEFNGLIFVSGQLARDKDGGEIIEGDITAQTKKVIQNIEKILKVADSSLDNILMSFVFLREKRLFDKFNEEYKKNFKRNYQQE